MSMPSDDDVSVASTTDEHTHESESCSVVDMAALEDFSDKFVRKPVTDVIAGERAAHTERELFVAKHLERVRVTVLIF